MLCSSAGVRKIKDLYGFAVMHGKTSRGALVFDIADLVKDAIVLPWAFIYARENATEQEFRQSNACNLLLTIRRWM